MQRRSNINLNSIGLGSIMLLLAMTFLAISPAVSAATYAEEGGNNADVSAAAEMGDNVSAAAEPTSSTSSVGIAFSNTEPSSGSISVNNTILPVKEENLTQANVLVTISAQKAKSYEVYLGSTSSDLVNKIGEEEYTIEGLTDADVSYESIPKNEWGYSVSTEKNVISDSYNRVPKTSETAHIIASNSNPSDIDPDYLTLSFAANIGNDMPSGTYSNTITLSVVSTPREITLMDIDTMQEMTNEICEETANDYQKQLKDVRDGKYYWVGKMPDDRCWMTQNLDLDLFDDVELKGDTTNLASTKDANVTWTPGQTTTTDGNTIHSDNDGQWSWSMGGPVIKPTTAPDYGYTSTNRPTDYYMTNPDSTTSCGDKLASVASCNKANDTDGNIARGGWVQIDVPLSSGGANANNAHRLLGNLYQWCAATAGCVNSSNSNQTGSSFTSGEAASSICPYGWKLPTGNTDGNLQKLSNALGATKGTSTSGTTKFLTNSPFYAVRGGHFYQNDNYRFRYVGNYGVYWSSTAFNDTRAYDLYFYNTDYINPSDNPVRQFGLPVRCINDPTK